MKLVFYLGLILSLFAIIFAPFSLVSAIDNSTNNQSPTAVNTIYRIQSGLVTSDSLTTGNLTNWTLYGNAITQNAPHSGSQDSSGLHIGMLAPSSGTWAGFFAVSPLTTAKLFHAKVTPPVAKPSASQSHAAIDHYLYVQQEMYQEPRINAIGCGATVHPKSTDWKIVWQQGNEKAITFFQSVYTNSSSQQPPSRDCTLVTDGSHMFKAYLDGKKVFSSSNMSLNMPSPFQSYLELQTNSNDSSTGKMFMGTFTDYYVTSGDHVAVLNAGAGGIVKIKDAVSGNTLVSSTAFPNGTAFLDVGKYHMPINANLEVRDSTGSIIASTLSPVGIYGGDVFNVGDSSVPQTRINIHSVNMLFGTPLPGIHATISKGIDKVGAGFTPFSYVAPRNAVYTVIMENFGELTFNHWGDDNSTYRAKVISPSSSSVNLTAFYSGPQAIENPSSVQYSPYLYLIIVISIITALVILIILIKFGKFSSL